MSKHDFPDKPGEQIERIEKMRLEGERWQASWGQRWDRNVAVARGDLWPDKGSKPLFLANLIAPTVRRKAGLLVEAKPGLDIRPRRSGLGVTADVLKRTSAAILDEQNQNMVWETLATYLAAFGCGFWKIGYDPLADFGSGDVCLGAVDPRLMLVDPIVREATDLWKANYLREACVVPYSWVQRMFPKTAEKVEPNNSFHFETNETHKISWFENLMQKMQKKAGALTEEESGYGRVFLETWWIADFSLDSSGNRRYPGGRRIFLTGDDVILNPNPDPEDLKYGQANPFWDGLWPYVLLDNEPDLDHPFGHAEVEALRKLNESFNAVGHMTVRTLVKNLAMIVADQGSIDAQTMQDLKEIEEFVIEKAPGRSVERQPPLQPSTVNMDFMRMIMMLVETSAGLNDGALQGKGRVELRSAPQLEGLQQAAQVLIRAQARRLENMIERGGQLLISRIFQYYTTDRIMTYTDNGKIKEYEFQKEQLRNEIVQLAKKEADQEAADETNENLEDGMKLERALVTPTLDEERIKEKVKAAWKLFRFKVIPFSTLATTKVARTQMLADMANQFMIPKSMVVEEAGFDNAEELQLQAIEEFKKGQAEGLPPPPPPKGAAKKK